MKLQLIMLKNPVIVSDEEIKEGELMYNEEFKTVIEAANSTLVNCTSQNGKGCKKVIAQSHQIDWNGLEAEFGYVDVEVWAKNEFKGLEDQYDKYRFGINGYVHGFKKAQDLNDKMFSLEDMREAMKMVSIEIATIDGELNSGSPAIIYKWIEKYIQQISQPKVFNIEVEMEAYCALCDKDYDKTNRCKQVRQEVSQCHIELDVNPKITEGKIKITKKL